MTRWSVSLVAFALWLSAGAPVLAAPTVALKLAASLVEQTADGSRFVPLSQQTHVTRGARIHYVVTASNAGRDPAVTLIASARIPTGTAYIPGSAHGPNGRVEFSLDGGKSWSSDPKVTVRTAAGTVVRSADPSAYTAIRWVGIPALATGSSFAYAYEVSVQ